MFLQNLYNWAWATMLTTSTVITGGESTPAAAPLADETAAGAAEGGFGIMGGGASMILIYAAVIGGMYFLMIRPQRKREKTMKEMQAALQVGDDVVTSGGFFGNIVSVGEDSFVIEFGTGKGVRIPVLKQHVVGKQKPYMTQASNKE